MMRKILFGSASALLLFGAAACSDSTDNTTTESIQQPETQQPAPMQPTNPDNPPAANGNTTTQGVSPRPQTGTGGDVPLNAPNATGADQPAAGQ